MSQSMSWFYDLSVNQCDKINRRNLNKRLLPHRLNDNLHWRCQSCQTQVSTHETEKHLKSCWNKFDESDDSKMMIVGHKSDPKDRPRTKKLETPTPNIKHPVIEAIVGSDGHDNKANDRGQKKLSVLMSSPCLKVKTSPLIKSSLESCKSSEVRKIRLTKSLRSLEGKSSYYYFCGRLSASERLKSVNENEETKEDKNEAPSEATKEKIISSYLVKCYLCKNEFSTEEMAVHEAECQEVSVHRE